MNQLVPIAAHVPALVRAAGERAQTRFWEFFVSNIRNPHTRRAYARATDEFFSWCADAGVPSIAAVQPVHVAKRFHAPSRDGFGRGVRLEYDSLVEGDGFEPLVPRMRKE